MTHIKEILGFSLAPNSMYMQRVTLANVRIAAKQVLGDAMMPFVNEIQFANGALTICANANIKKNLSDNHDALKNRINAILQCEMVKSIIIK
jgi:hypothetical protein